jgi:hypothetical protein
MPTASKNAETIVIHTSYRSDPATTSVADGEVADWVSHAVAYLGLANRQAELMMSIASEFGFTPASRSRISTPPQDQLPLLDLTANDYAQKEPDSRG